MGERLKEIQPKVYIASVSHVICCKVTVAIWKDHIEGGYRHRNSVRDKHRLPCGKLSFVFQ